MSNYVYPAPGPVVVTSPYGPRWHPVFNRYMDHNGTDYRAPTGTELYAVANGVVSGIRNYNHPVSGYWVGLRLDDGRFAYYSHLSRIQVPRVGYRVVKGQIIGKAGSTGSATGPHLHFGMTYNGSWVDPHAFLKSRGATVIDDAPSGSEFELSEAQYKAIMGRLNDVWEEVRVGRSGEWHDGPLASLTRAGRDQARAAKEVGQETYERVGRVGEQNTYNINQTRELLALMEAVDARVGRTGEQNTIIIRAQREFKKAFDDLLAALDEAETKEN